MSTVVSGAVSRSNAARSTNASVDAMNWSFLLLT